MGLFDIANARLADIEARLTALEGQTVEPPVMPPVAILSVKDYGAKGDGSTSDTAAFRAAMTAAVDAGKAVYVPSGTYRFTSSLALANGARFVGDGPDASVILGTSDFGFMMTAIDRSGISISDLGFRAPAHGTDVYGLFVGGCTSPRLSNLKMTNLEYGIKTGSGNIGSDYVFDRIQTVQCVTGLYLTCINGGKFTGMDINAVGVYGNQYHAMYMERDCNGLAFADCKWSGGGGYAMQLYISGTPTSGNITFDRCICDATGGRAPLVISQQFHDLVFRDFQIKGNASGYNNFHLYSGAKNILVDGFTSVGPGDLVDSGLSLAGVVFRNGSHDGRALGSSTGVTFENVSLL